MVTAAVSRRCLEVLKQTVHPGSTKVQLDWDLLAALLPEAPLRCASVRVSCGSRVSERSQRSRCPGDESWPRRPVAPDQRVAQQGTAGTRQGVGEGRGERRTTYTIAMDEKRN